MVLPLLIAASLFPASQDAPKPAPDPTLVDLRERGVVRPVTTEAVVAPDCMPGKDTELRHMLTPSRRAWSRAAIRSLGKPSAAKRIILARTTSKYGNVYLAARRRNSRSSSAESTIENGLVRAIERATSPPTMPYVSELFHSQIR